jgi:hypothetical protein
MTKEDDKNSVCSLEEVEVKDKENEDAEEDEGDAEEGEEEDESEGEDEEEDDDDDDDEYDPNIINFELLKNFFVDDEGNNVATHLGSIAKELRTLNKIFLKKNKD